MDFLTKIPPFNRWKILCKDMPLREMNDYDKYWQQRIDDLNANKNNNKSDDFVNLDHRKASRMEIVANYIDDGSSLLDIGSGAGWFMEYLLSKCKEIKVYGVDTSEKAVDFCRKKNLSCQTLDLLKNKLEREYDYISMMCVLEHIPEAEKLIQNIKESFKKQLFITIPNLGFWQNRLRLGLFGRMPLTGVFFHINEHVRFWTVKDFNVWTKAMGLNIVAIHGSGYLSAFRLGKRYPALFAEDIVYVLEKSDI